MISVYLREVDSGTPKACWVICDPDAPGAIVFWANPKPVKRLKLQQVQRLGGITSSVYAKWQAKTVLIWSGEHAMWWRPENAGYTNQYAAAGRYSFREAEPPLSLKISAPASTNPTA